jgi:hypothetical protein
MRVNTKPTTVSPRAQPSHFANRAITFAVPIGTAETRRGSRSFGVASRARVASHSPEGTENRVTVDAANLALARAYL